MEGESGVPRKMVTQINNKKAFLYSLFFHALFMGALIITITTTPRGTVKQMTWIEVLPDPEALLKKEDARTRERIVQTAKGQQVDKAVEDAFLGEKTQIVDRQTVATKKVDEPQKAASEQTQQKKMTKGESAIPEIAKLGVAMLPAVKLGDAQKDQDENWAQNTELSPTEYVKGFKESNRTALNTKEFVFYSYFQRIRDRLEVAWHRTLRSQIEKLYRSGRQIASDMDYTTRLQVTLNSIGEIVRVQIVEESSTLDLDSAAVKAFNDAGPFPNPPKGITEKDGSIKIRWDFVLKT